jgi:hypothetical protein
LKHVQVKQSNLENLFQQHYSQLRDLAQEDPRLLIQDSDNILEALAARLDQYEGELDDESFLAWASSAITPAVTRLATIYQWRYEHQDSVMKGIWSILKKCLDLRDHSQTSAILRNIESAVWVWAIEHYDDLLVPGTAKLSTRLYAQGKLHALTWRKSRLRDLERFDDSDAERYGSSEIIEVDESGNITTDTPYFYDPGGHDDDDPEDKPRQQTRYRPTPAPFDGQSGVPRLWCCICRVLCKVSPEPAAEGSLVLVCGHERPAQMAKMAAALNT